MILSLSLSLFVRSQRIDVISSSSRCDKNGDGILTEDEVREVIVLSASANRLSNLKENSSTYAALIMEKLDPDCKGYIEVSINLDSSNLLIHLFL